MCKVLEGVRVQGSRKVVYKVRIRSCTRSAYKVVYKVISTRCQSEHAHKVVYKASVLVHQLKGFLQTAICRCVCVYLWNQISLNNNYRFG